MNDNCWKKQKFITPNKVSGQDGWTPDMSKLNTPFDHISTYAEQYISTFGICVNSFVSVPNCYK